MINKVLSSIGIGSSRVDLVLPGDKFRAGEKIEGFLKVEGGISEQVVNKIYIQLAVRSRYKDDKGTREVNKVLDSSVLTEGFEVEAGEEAREIPVSYVLPENIPVTTSPTRLFLLTGMDISLAVDPGDTDPVEVLPGRRQEVVMRALEKELGFRRKKNTGAFNGHYQEFEYKPSSFMGGKLDELEVIYQVREEGIGLVLQIDKKSGGLLGGIVDELNLDERNVSCFISNSQLTTPEEVASLLANFIKEEYGKIIG